MLSNFLNDVSKEFGVVCLSTDCGNIAMWSHYADQHRGIVIGFDSTKLNARPWWPVEYRCERVGIEATTVGFRQRDWCKEDF
jgi:hypothetical protein